MKLISARRLLAAASIASCVFLLYFSWVRIHAIDDVICVFDTTFSSEIQQHIAARAQALKSSSVQEMVATLTEQFPCIAECGLQRQPNKQARVTLKAQKPIIRVNESLVLTKSARLVSRLDFDAQLIAQLPHVTISEDVASDALQLKELQTAIANIDPTLFDHFLISWRTGHEIVLADRASTHVQFLCCAYQLQNTELIYRYVDQVAQLLHERTISGSQKKQWIADVRFENQVILRGSKGGIHHGTCLS